MKLWPGENDRSPRRRIAPGAICAALLALVVWFGRLSIPAEAQDDPAVAAPVRIGMLIRIELPITAETVEKVEQFARRAIAKAREANAAPVLIFEFLVEAGQEEFAKETNFHDASKLADILSGKELRAAAGVTTVAYIPESLPGHAVLVALACDQIMMSADAELGPVGVSPESIGNQQLIVYHDIAELRKTVPAEVALWLLDPSKEVLVVETTLSRKYVFADGLEELRKEHTITSVKKLFDPENPEESVTQQRGQLSGQEARRLNFVSYLAARREDVAKALDLPPKAMQEELWLVGDWHAVRVDLKGPISRETINQAQSQIDKKIQQDEINFICLWIDSGGGSPSDSKRFADFLSTLDPGKVRTVAYIPSEARSDAALVALACHEVVMHPRAKLGGSGEYTLSDKEEIELIQRTIRNPNGPWKAKSWSLIAAMINPDLEVFRYTRPGEVGYFCQEELQELQAEDPDAKKWKLDVRVTRPGQPLLVDGQRAVEYGLADLTVESFAEFREYYRLEDDPTLLEPGWADFLIEALASPGVAALLLTIAFVALYAELHAPGIGIGAFVATVCFLLFFWSHYLGGTAGWLEIILFLTGIACLALEVFVLPGFGIFGLGGGCLVLISLILASQTFVVPRNPYQFGKLRGSLSTIAAAGVGIIAAAMLLRRWLPSTPIFNRMMLAPPEGEEAEDISRRESLVNLDDFVGARGVTTTQLTPSGKARFGDTLVDVITDGDVLPRGTPIEVVEVHGNRVVVKAANGKQYG